MGALPLTSVLSGAIFGAALTAAGVYTPTVIIEQMNLQDFHMMKVFLSANASSAIVIILANKFGFTATKPDLPRTLNWFSPYDGNIIGGALLGAGMTLTGACPGTVFPQIATRIRSSSLVLLGGVLGGILYSKFGKRLISTVNACDKQILEKPTVYQALNVPSGRAVAVFEALCLSVVAGLGFLAPERQKVLVPGAVGGVLIGGAQLAGLVLTGRALGFSTAFEQVGDLFWWVKEKVFDGTKRARPSIGLTAYAIGSILGSWGFSRLVDIPPVVDEVQIDALRAVLGGVLLLFGSRIGDGCTSGHGISGMSQLSISSFISVAAMFAGGMGLAALIGK